MLWISLVFALSVWALRFSVPVSAQSETTGGLIGHVVDLGGGVIGAATVTIDLKDAAAVAKLIADLDQKQINIRPLGGTLVSVTFDETTTISELQTLLYVFSAGKAKDVTTKIKNGIQYEW